MKNDNDDKPMQLHGCKLCGKGPTAYRFPSGYRQISCIECEAYVGGNDAKEVIKQWQQLNKVSKS